MNNVLKKWSFFLFVSMILSLNFAKAQLRDTQELQNIQQSKEGIVKPAFGFSPQSGLREGEMRIHGEPIIVELALDSPSQSQGLMYRESMPSDRGMLFMFPRTQPLSFWMKNTLIPLDIIYIAENGDVVDIIQAEPCKTERCPSYPAKALGKYVLELNAGEAEKRGLKVGDNLIWKWN